MVRDRIGRGRGGGEKGGGGVGGQGSRISPLRRKDSQEAAESIEETMAEEEEANESWERDGETPREALA